MLTYAVIEEGTEGTIRPPKVSHHGFTILEIRISNNRQVRRCNGKGLGGRKNAELETECKNDECFVPQKILITQNKKNRIIP